MFISNYLNWSFLHSQLHNKFNPSNNNPFLKTAELGPCNVSGLFLRLKAKNTHFLCTNYTFLFVSRLGSILGFYRCVFILWLTVIKIAIFIMYYTLHCIIFSAINYLLSVLLLFFVFYYFYYYLVLMVTKQFPHCGINQSSIYPSIPTNQLLVCKHLHTWSTNQNIKDSSNFVVIQCSLILLLKYIQSG